MTLYTGIEWNVDRWGESCAVRFSNTSNGWVSDRVDERPVTSSIRQDEGLFVLPARKWCFVVPAANKWCFIVPQTQKWCFIVFLANKWWFIVLAATSGYWSVVLVQAVLGVKSKSHRGCCCKVNSTQNLQLSPVESGGVIFMQSRQFCVC